MDFAYECRFDILMQGPCQSSLYHSNFIHHISCRGSLPRAGLDHEISDLSVYLNIQLDTLDMWVDTSGHWWTLGGGHLVTLGGHSLVDNSELLVRHLVDTQQALSKHLLFGCENMSGKCLRLIWDLSGTCLGLVWEVSWKCLGYVWEVFEKCWRKFGETF